ncbi:aminotransferase class V-fold PLP-dependent enzyme [Planctomicrobium sp. SH661]|uniref:aminotransferase class V-fold PLP-dependent enzyme n=1 Tax=Planctomicrobium sp. SH661 TaxID=3448124 RepID=UPI003F5AF7A7
MLSASAQAVSRYLRDKSQGEPGRVALWKEYEAARQKGARLFAVRPDQMALVGSTTEALNSISNAIDWKPGDEVVFTSVEFPSNLFPWVALQRRGVRTRVVAPRDGLVRMEDILDQITPRTRLVTLSQVSYATGQYLDPRPIWKAVSKTRSLLCVDATQAAARVPVYGDQADFTVASAFKWMNSIHGAALLSVGDRVLQSALMGPVGWLSAKNQFAPDRLERFHPREDAQRFQAGMPNFASVYALSAALDFHTPEQVSQRRDKMEPLVSRVWQTLSELGLDVLTPESLHHRAGIVSVSSPDASWLKQKLAEQGVYVHAHDGRVRAAIHWHNSAAEIDRFLTSMQQIEPGLMRA